MGWLFLQAQQIAACNAVHAADARFCRRLLRASDALGEDTILATQETIAQALGIRRTTATLIAQQFQLRGVISYRLGKNCHPDATRCRPPGAIAVMCSIATAGRPSCLSVGIVPMPTVTPSQLGRSTFERLPQSRLLNGSRAPGPTLSSRPSGYPLSYFCTTPCTTHARFGGIAANSRNARRWRSRSRILIEFRVDRL